ncbi:hypothetical protein BD626DRAFT_404399, partial [Schizophyllum amplum]
MGVSDPEGARLAGRTFTASALRSLLPHASSRPDLVIHRSSAASPEYNNPNLFPGMFPTLFPNGYGGFEDPQRVIPISMEKQAEYFLDVDHHAFGKHHAFIFVVLNILQRRKSHLHSHFTVNRTSFEAVATELASIPVENIIKVANHLEHEGKVNELDDNGRRVLLLLDKVRSVSAKVPGSEASKIAIRNDIRNYFGFFGMPFLYFTFNPSPVHSPIFQVMFGDETVDLSTRYPSLVPGPERARRLAADPIAAADFFEFSYRTLFTHLFGWDYDHHESTPTGGILGRVKAFYGTSE